MITRDLNQINDRFTDLAEGEGDLTVRFNTKRSDELGRLSHSFDRFMDKLHSLISEIIYIYFGIELFISIFVYESIFVSEVFR